MHPTSNKKRVQRRKAPLWLCRLAGDRAGGVTMEYVVLAVIIAAAVVVAVVTFGRSIVTMFITAGQGASGQHTAAKADLDMRAGDRQDDANKSKQYHDDMHE